MPTPPGRASAAPGASLEARVQAVGRDLGATLAAVLEELPEGAAGPQRLASSLGLDKVLTSRLQKALRSRDPIAVVYHAPGPEPLRRLLKAARKAGAAGERVAAATEAVERFADLVRVEAGDRSALGAVLSAWLPEARAEFELRRKQSAFKALGELKGAVADVDLATVLLAPSASGRNLDVVWVFGLLGLRRLRPEVPVKFSTRRMVADDGAPRRPTSLRGEPVADLADLRLDAFCTAPPSPLEVQRIGDCVHYLLGASDFGPRAEGDLLYAEANFEEMPRYVPRELGRKGYTYSQVVVPSRVLVHDVFVHADVYPGSEPGLVIYDTTHDGPADVNDRARDVDRWDLSETIQPLGRGLGRFRCKDVPRYDEVLRHVFAEVGWDGEAFRGYRARVDYPVYGTQVAVTFDPPPPPEAQM